MGYLGTEIRDGALYCDITPQSLGLPMYSMSGFRIMWPSHIWENIGKAFEEQAKATCPVRTGYLRAHIGYASDAGGTECWSDAPYSAYQEYGTSRMHAQPYFESALQSAVESVQSDIDANVMFYNDLDADWMFLMGSSRNPMSVEECQMMINRILHLIAIIEADGRYDPTPLYDAYYELNERLQYLLEQERMQAGGGLLGFAAQLLGMILGELIVEILTMPLTLLDGVTLESSEDDTHTPTH